MSLHDKQGEAETKGKEKVTVGEKWRNERKEGATWVLLPFRSEGSTDREERKMEVKV